MLLNHYKEKQYLPTILLHNIWQLSCTVISPEDLFHSLIDVLSILTLLDFQGLPSQENSCLISAAWPVGLSLYSALMDLLSLSLTAWIQWFFLILGAGQDRSWTWQLWALWPWRSKQRLFCFGGCQAVSLQAGKGLLAVPFPSSSLNEYNTPF